MFNLGSILAFATLALATSRTSAPSGALVVGSSGKYSTIQKAVNALSSTSTSAQSIFIEAGTYNEQVTISSLKGALTIYGYTADTSSYAGNKVTITAAHALANEATDDATGTLRVETKNFKMYNVNVKNTYGSAASSGQALALSANAGNQGYFGCGFYGFQDTILAETGAQVYGRCYIEGATDFIFGQSALAWFDACDIRVLKASLGYITASGRASDTTSYYVINNSTIAAASGNTVPTGAFYLGRPWDNYARVAFQMTTMSAVVNTAGWSKWSSASPLTDHVSFGEYDNSGTGSKGTRASFASKLSKAVPITEILGSSYESLSFVDTGYLS
ncbi:hypothetical protein LTR08_008365 [Meristemomyces frigidus]|nr:hypothetical protein LTR08_008365 [Meristemomyces frigidus]